MADEAKGGKKMKELVATRIGNGLFLKDKHRLINITLKSKSVCSLEKRSKQAEHSLSQQ